MTKLRAHYDAKLKAWVSEDGREWPHGTEAEVEIGAAPGGNVEAGDDWEIPPLPPPPENAPVHITGGLGISGSIAFTNVSGTGVADWQYCGQPFSYCGHNPCTMNPNRRCSPHCNGSRAPFGPAQYSGDHDSANR